MKWNDKRGQVFVEILIVSAVFALIAGAVVPAWVGSLEVGKQGIDYSVAAGYVSEGIAAARSIRDRDWAEIETGTHGLALQGAAYVFSGTSEILENGFTRSIIVEDVYRTGSLTGDIAGNGDTLDSNAKRVTVNVAWEVGAGNHQNLDTQIYLMNWKDPLWAQTTITDFTYGSENSTDVSATGNGSVILRASQADWNVLERFYAMNLSGTGQRIAMQFDRERDVLYVLSTNTDGNEFVLLDTSAVSEASPVVIGGFEAANTSGFVEHNGYLYLVGSGDAGEIKVYDTQTLVLVRIINMSGNADAMGVGVFGTTLAVARDQEDDAVAFYDITNPVLSMSLLGQTDLDEHVEKVALTQTHAYVGGRDNEEEIFVIRLSDFSEVASVDLAGNNDVQMLLVKGDRLYVSRTNGTGWDFGALDISDPTTPTLVGTHELGVDAGGFAINPSATYAQMTENWWLLI